MANNKNTKKKQGWVINNYEKHGVWNLYVADRNYTPNNYIKYSSLNKKELKAVEEAIERGSLLYIEELPNTDKGVDTSVNKESKRTRIKHLDNGSVVSEPYKDPDAFVNQTWKEVATQVQEIDDIDILHLYKERAEALMKSKKAITAIDNRIAEVSKDLNKKDK